MFLRYNKRRRTKILKFIFILSILVIVFLIFTLHNYKINNNSMPVGVWGLSFQNVGSVPVPNLAAEELIVHNAFFYDTQNTDNIYLTFDCGYENENTETILDALKNHNAPATFFVVGSYVKENPELLMRMLNEGHMIASHTFSHPDVTQLSFENFESELKQLEKIYFETTGQQISKYFRPPEGRYTNESLQYANDLGYKTIFWSLAYTDWKVNEQPSQEQAFSKLLTRVHDGAIILLHNTSSTNAKILNELLTQYKNMGYNFAPLTELDT